MLHGFIKVAAATPKIKVADCIYNADAIITLVKEADKQGVKLIVFPELCITGYTCEDLFWQDTLLQSAKEQLLRIVEETKDLDLLGIVGLPFLKNSKLYNVAAIFGQGKILGFVPKTHLPNHSEFYELRHFAIGNEEPELILYYGEEVYFGTNLLFQCVNFPNLILSVELCEDLWVASPPSIRHALAGATVIANLSASDETTGKDSYRKELVKSQSARLVVAYIYADAGEGESTTDLVFAGHNIIGENGILLAQSERFTTGIITAQLDLEKICNERRRINSFIPNTLANYRVITFSYGFKVLPIIPLERMIEKTPFVPDEKVDRDYRCEEIISIQAIGLKKRLEHTKCKSAVIGISGGLDSALALLITTKAFDLLGIHHKNIIAVTMPCFGTTNRTYQNAISLTKQLNVSLLEVPIKEAVTMHLNDIKHDINIHDITYENAQARERTQILMSIANERGGMVIGTGDMSELALGWATYNGDHMSMYGVNSSVPKTLVRYLVFYFSTTTQDKVLKDILLNVLDTPVSPELLPPTKGEISQKTEDLVGPYELHDFFLYYVMRFGFRPSKILRLAAKAFEGIYTKQIIYKWLTIFYKRFFSQQFKRSCLPDGPKVGSVAISPRGDLKMPSDACVRLWLEELETIQIK